MPPDALSELRDIHLPPAPGWWPPAPGWWMLALLAIALLIVVWVALRRRSARARPRRRALELLHQLADAGSDDPREGVRRLSLLLRRAALHAFPRDQVAGLTGTAWLQFLDRTGRTDQFTRGPGRILASDPYRADGPASLDPVLGIAERWIRANL